RRRRRQVAGDVPLRQRLRGGASPGLDPGLLTALPAVATRGPHGGGVLTMKARWPALLLILAVACGGGSPHTLSSASPSPGGPGGTGPGPTPSSGPPPISLPRVVLTADLSERPAPWTLIAHIPFGHQASSLGVVLPPEHTSVPEIPVSFAVAPDGTLWVLDVVKKRIARFTSAGRYLGEIGGLRFGPVSPHPRRLPLVGGRPGLPLAGAPLPA